MTPYVALYRKYRPRSFSELVGQEAIARTLTSAITQSRLAHAYLFCGPRGTGKTSVARILAKSINCQTGPTAFPCGECTTCLEIANGTNLDVVEIDAASNNGVDNIRDLQDRVALAPVGGRYKVYIIDEVHMLSQGAFNALLKTLEEPPPNVIFMLATTDAHKVLPTVVSRCQRFDFGRIALAPLVARLTYVAGEEAILIEPAGLEAIARRANGGLRDALSLLDQAAAMAAGQPLSADEVAQSLGLLAGDKLAAVGQALVEGDAPVALELAHGLLQAGHDHATIVRELMGHFRHLLVLQLAPDRADVLDVPTGQLPALKAQAARMQPAEIAWALEALNEVESTLRRSPQQAIWLELGLIKLARRPAIPSVVELAERVAALEAVMQGGEPLGRAPLARAVPAVPAPQAVPPIAPAPVYAPPPPPAVAPLPAPPPPVVERPRSDSNPYDLPPRPPLAEPRSTPVEAAPLAEMAPAPDGGAQRPVPPGAWDRVREHIKARSMPTAALLEQQAVIDRWESDGAVVVRIARAYKDIFDKQAPKKKILGEAIVAVFGAGAFPRLEVGDPKAVKPATPAARPVPPSPNYVAPAPPPTPPAPVARPGEAPRPTEALRPPVLAPEPPAFLHEPPPEDAPPAWLDDYESAREPESDFGQVVPAAAVPVTLPVREPGVQDSAVKLAVELFNGRIVKPTEPSTGSEQPS